MKDETSYIQSIACTKYVSKNGNITQNHSGSTIRNPTVRSSDTAKNNQYFALDFEVDVILNSCSYTLNSLQN